MRTIIFPIVDLVARGTITGFCLTVGGMAAKELAKRVGYQTDDADQESENPTTATEPTEEL